MRRVQRAFRVDNGLRGPAAGRAQQEARAAAAAAAAQQQLRSEGDVRALMEVSASAIILMASHASVSQAGSMLLN